MKGVALIAAMVAVGIAGPGTALLRASPDAQAQVQSISFGPGFTPDRGSVTQPIALGGGTGVTSGLIASGATGGIQYASISVNADGTIISVGPRPPEGAIYHQVVDRYFDAAGNQIEAKSATHAVDLDCHGGRRQQDLVATIHDDDKGNVRFGPQEPETNLAAAR